MCDRTLNDSPPYVSVACGVEDEYGINTISGRKVFTIVLYRVNSVIIMQDKKEKDYLRRLFQVMHYLCVYII